LYSEDGDGVYPAIGKIMHTDHEGFLYTVASEPFPQVRKYKVVMNE